MSFDLLNPVMLVGLAAVVLPILAHLLSKKRFDVVEWGAMRFLELGEQRRRHVRLEELLLLLTRMGIVALVALALTRPTVSGGFLTSYISTENRDTVFVVDGSYSMGWEGDELSPHERARDVVRRFTEHARPGDTLAVLDARDLVRPVIGKPTRDIDRVKQAMDELPLPAGTTGLAEAVTKAVELLATTSNVRRDVIVLTDGQLRGWHADDPQRWDAVEELRSQPTVTPNIWTVNVSQAAKEPRTNFSLGELNISRETAPLGFPVRVSTTLKYTGGTRPAQCNIYLEADGQRLAEATVQSPLLEPGGEFGVEFEYRFQSPGSHLLSVVLDADNLPGDDRAEAAIHVSEAIPVLLVDGDPHVDPTRSETFFATAALRGDDQREPLVRSTVVRSAQLDSKAVNGAHVIVLANVASLSDNQAALLREFVAAGGGLLIAAGNRVEATGYPGELAGILPAELLDYVSLGETGLGIDPLRMEQPWPLSDEEIDELATARLTHRWKVQPEEQGAVLARFETGEPWLLSTTHGRGRVLLLTVPLDADAGTLPTKSVYVPLLHEMVFYLASAGRTRQNVRVGEPLSFAAATITADEEFYFVGPTGENLPATITGSGRQPLVRLDDTGLPGVYTLRRTYRTRAGTEAVETVPFVVNFDRGESDLTPLDDEEIKRLSADGRMVLLDSYTELEKRLLTDVSRTELWQLLLVVVLGMLCLEVWMTRRLVRGGHAVLDDAA